MQFHYLPNRWNDYDLTRYEASLLITLKFNADAIEKILNEKIIDPRIFDHKIFDQRIFDQGAHQ